MRTARSLLTLFFAVGSAAAQAQDYPRTIVDDRNQSVVIERATNRRINFDLRG
ncbi:hypothetical protein P4132_04885 [Pseudomonas aeruginosa]|nr:hypothetical protein [Pseudomonas aeruginosa]